MSLLLKIARCQELPIACRDHSHKCNVVARAQGKDATDRFVPEPWSGHLSRAKILFITANPSLDQKEQFPRSDWSDLAIEDFFENRFGDGAKRWTVNGSRVLRSDGSYGNAVPTWSEIRNNASILLDRPAIPGDDYAITDIVHCKSKRAVGVREALDFCVNRYLAEILQSAKARVLIAVGPARRPVGNLLFGGVASKSPQQVSVGGTAKVLVSMGSPGSSEARKFPGALQNKVLDLAVLRTFL